jgi:hypothetical protein
MGTHFLRDWQAESQKNSTIMKYFTPELYLKYATASFDEAEAVERQWEQAEASYRRELTHIRGQLPKALRRLAKMSFKDGILFNLLESAAEAVLWIRQGPLLVVLHYSLLEPVQKTKTIASPFLAEEQPRWLYDEVQLAGKDCFAHEILFSSGFILRFVFNSLHLLAEEVHPLGTAERLDAVNHSGLRYPKKTLRRQSAARRETKSGGSRRKSHSATAAPSTMSRGVTLASKMIGRMISAATKKSANPRRKDVRTWDQ